MQVFTNFVPVKVFLQIQIIYRGVVIPSIQNAGISSPIPTSLCLRRDTSYRREALYSIIVYRL